MTITFATPASGSGDSLKPADVAGHTLIVYPTELIGEIQTTYGPSDAIRVNVHDLTAAANGEEATYHDVLWFSGYIIGALKGRIGQHLLVRVEQGTASKAGQSPPWLVIDAQDNAAAVQAAQAWLAANPGVLEGTPVPSFTTPATDAAPAQRPF